MGAAIKAPDTPPAGGASGVAGARRYPFIDILRGLAVVFMIETHTVNALLIPREDGGLLRSALTFVNGLVAPAFLFCAGLGFAISLWRHAASNRPGRGQALSLVKKSLFIMLVGYSMHAPVFSLRGMIAASPEVRDAIFQVDILQVIAVSLLLLLGVALLFRTARARIGAAAFLGACMVVCGAVAGDAAFFTGRVEGVPVWLGAYFSRELSPLFTLVPWAAYPAAGFVAGTLFMRRAEVGEEARIIRLTSLASGAALVVATIIALNTVGSGGGDAFWYWGAEYVVVRLAAVVLAMCAIWFLARGGTGRVGRALGLFGRESLPVYYWHLIIVYGRDVDWSFVRLFPEGMGAAACLGMAAALTVAMYALARGWSTGKKIAPRASLWVVRGMVAGSIATFILA
jgi:uncharacterized membrane protein